jgi:hypothetical protein
MTEQKRAYLAYLLRLWQARCDDAMVWRASLESAQTGEHRGFANLQELYAFLVDEVDEMTQGQTTSSVRGKGGDIDK